jgi:hypothetical protein
VIDLDDGSEEADFAQEAIVLFSDDQVVIEDDAAFQAVATRLIERRAWIARVEEFFRPLAQAADAAHKAITRRRAAILDGPRKQCEQDGKALGLYESRKRREAEIAAARAQQELAVAVEVARREGVDLGPLVAAPMVESAPKATGLAFVDLWLAEVTDLRALARAVGEGQVSEAALSANVHYLNDLAVQLKGAFAVPGVRAITKRVPRRT